jgi:hypothetical protein
MPGARYLRPFFEGRIGIADGAVVADVGGDDRFFGQGFDDGPPGHAGRHFFRLTLLGALVPGGAGIVFFMIHGGQFLGPVGLGFCDGCLACVAAGVTGGGGKLARMALATFLASPTMPTVTGLVRPMRSGLMSTWIMAASVGQ